MYMRFCSKLSLIVDILSLLINYVLNEDELL